MGQYHWTVNVTKKEFLDPHKLGDGLKLVEQNGNNGGVCSALHMLLASSNGRGGGDFEIHPLIGSWAGDRIAVIGDYSKAGDIRGRINPERMMKIIGGNDPTFIYKDISDQMIPLLEKNCEVRFDTDSNGWRSRRDAMGNEEYSQMKECLSFLEAILDNDDKDIRHNMKWRVARMKAEMKLGRRKALEGPVINEPSMV